MRGKIHRRAGATAGIALIGVCLSSCDTMKTVGDTAKKPFAAAKAINPMRLLKKDKVEADEGDLAEGIEVAATDGTPPQPVDWPSQNTATPGAQPTPGAGNASRESLTLPTRPELVEPITPISDPLPTIAAPATPSPLELPTTPADAGPLSTPPRLDVEDEDDGFLRLTPKLPEEEDILPPN